MNNLYKGLLKNYSVQLADKVICESQENKEKIYNDIFESLEKYVINILPIKIEEGSEPAYKEIVYDYDKFNSFLAGKLDKRDTIEKRMTLLGISRKLFTHSLPLVVAEQCYDSLLRENRHLILNSPSLKKQEMAYNMLITLIEDYNVKLLSTKIYWEVPGDREEYKEFWDNYQKVLRLKDTPENKEKRKQILFIKRDMKKLNSEEAQAKLIIKFYKSKLVELGAINHLKNSYAKCSNIKLTGKQCKKEEKRRQAI